MVMSLIPVVASRQDGSLVLVSSRPPSEDTFLIELLSNVPRATYARSDSSYGENIARRYSLDPGFAIALVNVDSGKIETTPETILEALHRSKAGQGYSLSATTFGFLSTIAALAFPFIIHRYLLILLGTALLALVWKVTHPCSTCVGPLFLNIVGSDIAGVFLFASLFVIQLLNPSYGALSAALCLPFAVTWQAIQFVSSPDECVPCTIAFGCSLMIVFSWSSVWLSQKMNGTLQRELKYSNVLYSLGCIAAFSLVFALHGPVSE